MVFGYLAFEFIVAAASAIYISVPVSRCAGYPVMAKVCLLDLCKAATSAWKPDRFYQKK